MIKKIITALLTAITLITIPGCLVRTVTLHEKHFDTLDELKAAAGDGLLYPAEIPPAGFEPAHIEISGYDDKSTWNYRIVMRGGNDMPDEGAPAVNYIKIYAFEPKLDVPVSGIVTKWPNMQEELDAYSYYRQLPDQEDGPEIGGVAWRRYSGFSVRAGADDGPAYTSARADGGFMRGGLLYMVKTEFIGHPGETEEKMLETADNLLEIIVRGMLSAGK